MGRYRNESIPWNFKHKKGKGEKDRLVPLNATERAILVDYQDSLEIKKEYLFYGIRKNRMNEDSVLRMFYALSKQAKVKVTPHTLRHTFCKNLF